MRDIREESDSVDFTMCGQSVHSVIRGRKKKNNNKKGDTKTFRKLHVFGSIFTT